LAAIVLRASYRREAQRCDQQNERRRATPQATVHHFSPSLAETFIPGRTAIASLRRGFIARVI
jgi:hypothetical protein